MDQKHWCSPSVTNRQFAVSFQIISIAELNVLTGDSKDYEELSAEGDDGDTAMEDEDKDEEDHQMLDEEKMETENSYTHRTHFTITVPTDSIPPYMPPPPPMPSLLPHKPSPPQQKSPPALATTPSTTTTECFCASLTVRPAEHRWVVQWKDQKQSRLFSQLQQQCQ
jgi:hypothetical protein